MNHHDLSSRPAIAAIAIALSLGLGACRRVEDADSSKAAEVGGSPGKPNAAGAADAAADGGTTSPAEVPVPPCTTSLAPWLEKLNVPGLSVGIVKNGRLACTGVAGMANIEEKRPVTPSTLFCVASVSKTVTAVAAMQVVDDGKAALDEDVDAHFPFTVRIPGCEATPVTLRELLAHTSSITDNLTLINCPGDCKYGDPLVNMVTRGADSPTPLSTLVPQYLVPGSPLYDAKANFLPTCPGTQSSYSNMGVVTAGYLVEKATGTRLEQFTKDRIFTPLGMTETAWKIADIDPTHLAMPYDHDATGWTPYGQFGEPDWPDGMLRTSVPELARFLLMFMQFGEYGGKQVLSRTSAEEMRRVQAPTLDDTQGLVWFFDDFGKRTKVMGHDGSDNGVSANMYFDPADGAGVIVLSNGMWESTENASDAADDLMEALFDESTTY
jgi:CubicO group peptidase (beta-lactamase class C family)